MKQGAMQLLGLLQNTQWLMSPEETHAVKSIMSSLTHSLYKAEIEVTGE